MSERLQELKLREIAMPEPPTDTAERVWRGIEGRVASGEPAMELHGGPLVAEAPARAVVLKLVIGGLVLLGIVGGAAVGVSRWGGEEAARVVLEEVPPPSRQPAPIVSAAVPAPPPVVEAVSPPPPAVVEAPKPKPKPEPDPEPKPRTLADEVALIQAISKALKQTEWKTVLKLVAEHERDFANGQFVEERDAGKVRAQCRSGALDAGRKAAERFSDRWPSSIHRATIRQDCEL
jgi:hypothetical protein